MTRLDDRLLQVGFRVQNSLLRDSVKPTGSSEFNGFEPRLKSAKNRFQLKH